MPDMALATSHLAVYTLLLPLPNPALRRHRLVRPTCQRKPPCQSKANERRCEGPRGGESGSYWRALKNAPRPRANNMQPPCCSCSSAPTPLSVTCRPPPCRRVQVQVELVVAVWGGCEELPDAEERGGPVVDPGPNIKERRPDNAAHQLPS
jgi:hypothetical protein